MRRRDHVFDTVFEGKPGHVHGFFKTPSTVIDVRHDVGVDVDHFCTSVNAKSSSQTFPLSRLSSFFEGTRRNCTVAISEVAVNGIVNCCQYVVPTCFSDACPLTSTKTPSLVVMDSVFIQKV